MKPVKKTDLVMLIIIVICVVSIAPISMYADSQLQKETDRRNREFEAKIQSVCEKDVVFSYDRIGALRSSDCWKVVCFHTAENVSKEYVKCFEIQKP